MSYNFGMDAAHMILSSRWKATGDEPAKASPGDTAIQEIERRYHVTLPKDFRSYLLEIAPRDHFTDDEMVTWWSPSKIKNIPDKISSRICNPVVAAEAEAYLFFADFLIWSSAWAICCCDGLDYGKVVSVDGVNDHFVATSFTAFAKAYVAEPFSML